jgi:peptidylprolyl isomerase
MLALTRRALIALPLLAALPAFAADAPTDTIDMKTKYGDVIIKLLPDIAPKHVKQIQTLVARHFYDGLKFHRVIPGFMAQTGDPKGDGTGGSDLPNIPLEASATPFKAGTVGMARSQDPDSANSQFFICTGDAPFLNGSYTVFGEVVSGMDAIDKLKHGTQENNGAVKNPDRIVSMRFAPDTK